MSQSEPSAPSALPISTAHVLRQFARRGDLSDAQFLYGEVAQRMADKLRVVRLQPARVLDAGCGAGASLPLLRALYPKANYVGLDACAPLLEHARRHEPAPNIAGRLRQWLRPARNPPVRFMQADMGATGLPPESFDMLWSNMALHWHPTPHTVLAEWRRVLRVDGLLMFSCLGPGTLRELRQAITDAHLQTAMPGFVDMHDFGDLLVEHGFADAVMDQETLTLTYTTPQALLRDVRALGGNPALGRRASLPSKQWLNRLCAALEARRGADGRIALSIEVAYGHAWRAPAHRTTSGETHISLNAIAGRRARGSADG